jgi:hypothetical protein
MSGSEIRMLAQSIMDNDVSHTGQTPDGIAGMQKINVYYPIPSHAAARNRTSREGCAPEIKSTCGTLQWNKSISWTAHHSTTVAQEVISLESDAQTLHILLNPQKGDIE